MINRCHGRTMTTRRLLFTHGQGNSLAVAQAVGRVGRLLGRDRNGKPRAGRETKVDPIELYRPGLGFDSRGEINQSETENRQ
jgi:hypothetical protein